MTRDEYVTRGLHRLRKPEDTVKDVLERLESHRPRLLQGFHKVATPAGVPQYRVVGTSAYSRVVGARGSNGKGHTWPHALASGLMEFVERYSCWQHLLSRRHAVRCPADQLPRPGGNLGILWRSRWESPTAVLSRDDLEKVPLTWFRARSLDGEAAYIPELVNRSFAHAHGSNGMAAGTDVAEAVLQGLCEVIERHCLTRVLYGGWSPPLVRPSTIRSRTARALMRRFERLGHEVLVCDYSAIAGLPAFGVVRVLGSGKIQLNAGVAPWREEALIRALTENSQSEGQGSEGGFDRAEGGFLLRNDGEVDFADVVDLAGGSHADELQRCRNAIETRGWRAYVLDTTAPSLRIPAVIVAVDGAPCRLPGTLFRPLAVAVATDALHAGDLETAWSLVEHGPSDEPDCEAQYRYARGQILAAQGSPEAAFEELRRVWELCRDTPEHRETRGVRRLALKAAQEAGHCCLRMGDAEQAMEWYARVWPALTQESRDRASV